jgi:hypothetical protein
MDSECIRKYFDTPVLHLPGGTHYDQIPKFKMTAEISRRAFCKWSSALVMAGTFAGVKNRLLLALDQPASGATLKEIHTPKLILPAVTRNGNHVPVVHGTWTARERITIPEGQGGCATAEGIKQIAAKEEILPPVIRIPELVRRGRLVKGETSEVQVKFKHPSKTGLAYENHKFVQLEEPFYLTSMQVFYGERLVSRYEMTAGLSDNPFLKFKLKFTEEKPIRIVFTNSKGRQFSGSTEVVLA